MESPPNGRKPAGELSSWKQVAAFLHVSVRTAQKWELEKGLPVRRMPGSSGRVSADTAELTHWKEQIEQAQPWWARANVRAYYAFILPVLLIGMLFHDLWFHHRPRPRVPASYRLEWSELVVLDTHGVELWRKAFPSPFAMDQSSARQAAYPPVAFLDVNQDGGKEVLFVRKAADFEQDELFCYSADGRELWRFLS